MKNIVKLSILVFSSLYIIACGSSGEVNGVSSNITVTLDKATLSSDKKSMDVKLTLLNNYSSKMIVQVKDLDFKNVAPCEIENSNFEPNEFTFSSSRQSINAQLTFVEACTPESYDLRGTTVLTLDGQKKEIPLSSTSVDLNVSESTNIGNTGNTIIPDTNTTDETNSSVDTINYGIKFSLEDEEVMGFNLEDKKSIKITLIDKDNGYFISSKKIVSLKVTSKQENLLKLFDATQNTTPSAVVSYDKVNNIVVYAQTYTRSGLADIDVEIEYLNANGGTEKVSKTYSTMIMSGPPTAFSINTAGVSYNSETKWFENKFLISAVDRYNNIVNISPTIYVSAMTGFTRDSNGKEVLYGNFGEVEGKLNVDKESKVASFEANNTIFDNIDVNRDYLYVFGKVDDYEALGKWDIDRFESSHTRTTLALSDAFNGENHDKLGFALGHNYIIDPGSSESAEWQVKIDSTDGKYQLDEEGKAFVTLKFPPYIIGKRIALAVNFLGKTPETGKILRSGEVKFKTLSSFKGVLTPDSITVEKDTIGSVSKSRAFYVDTGTEDRWRILNSHVSCRTKSDNLRIVGFRQNTIVSTIDEFKANANSYAAYWSLELELIDTTKSGSYSFSECQVRTLPLF